MQRYSSNIVLLFVVICCLALHLGCSHQNVRSSDQQVITNNSQDVSTSGQKKGFLKNVGEFYQGLGKQFHKFADQSDEGIIKDASHLGGRMHEGIGDGIVDTPEEEGIGGMIKNVTSNGWNALFGKDEND